MEAEKGRREGTFLIEDIYDAHLTGVIRGRGGRLTRACGPGSTRGC